ncbi:MAG: SAM hydrolase/SAM-dependent halogenase family protein [Woeseiaceae bacterium]
MTDWTASGVITVTTDFGHKGPFAAVMTGVIVQRFPDARVIDLAHDIPAHWPPEAGFWLSRSYTYFPNGTVHVAIVDPGVGTEREIIIAQKEQHLFMAPDNGLLAPVLEVADRICRLDIEKLASFDIGESSLTFQGRDIFAPVAAELAAGRMALDDIGVDFQDWTPGWLDEPDVQSDRVNGVIVTVDAFGNLISNIDASLIEPFENPRVEIGGRQIDMKPTYGRAKPGDYLALVNSFGVVEVARAEESAAEGLGCERGAPISITTG